MVGGVHWFGRLSRSRAIKLIFSTSPHEQYVWMIESGMFMDWCMVDFAERTKQMYSKVVSVRNKNGKPWGTARGLWLRTNVSAIDIVFIKILATPCAYLHDLKKKNESVFIFEVIRNSMFIDWDLFLLCLHEVWNWHFLLIVVTVFMYLLSVWHGDISN
jgi:hypothetical protein